MSGTDNNIGFVFYPRRMIVVFIVFPKAKVSKISIIRTEKLLCIGRFHNGKNVIEFIYTN